MSIYTKTGDNGSTTTFGNKKVIKSDPQIEAYGTIDEATSFIGLTILKVNKNHQLALTQIQKDLYQIMTFLAGGETDLNLMEKEVDRFEKEIDKMQKHLPELNRFIIPGGTEVSSLLHIIRTICRRAERKIVNYFFSNGTMEQWNNKLIIKYLNRLSDYFFVLARFYNQKKEQTI